MGWLTATAAALLISSAAPAIAEEKLPHQTTAPGPSAPPVLIVPVTFEVDDPQVAAVKLQAALLDRLRPLEARFREDTRIRRVGALVGVSAVALGAFRREQALVAVGSGALRLGLERQLSAVHQKTGFAMSPRLERRGFSLFLTKTLQ